MADKRKLRLLGGRFEEAETPDSLNDLVGQTWDEIHRLSEKVTHAERTTQAQDGLSSPSDLAEKGILRDKRVLLYGAGAVGSKDAMLLAPYGATLVVVDHDVIEIRNVREGRTAYSTEDVGKRKVFALRDMIGEQFPGTRVIPHPRNVNEISMGELQHWARESDIALVAIDEGEALFHLNKALYPLLTIFYQGVHRQGRSGQIIITRPGSACLKCCLGARQGTDIETLHGEQAMGIHFAAIAQLGVQLVVQELATFDNRSGLGDPLGLEVSILFVSNMASELTPYGPGVIPFSVERDPSCDVCGNQPR